MEDTKTRNSKNRTLIPDGLLPSYLASAFGDLYEEDGLIVLGKGLGLLNLLASFVRFYADTKEGHLSILQEKEDVGLVTKGRLGLCCGRCRCHCNCVLQLMLNAQ
jgi:hypothetical protein